MDPQMTLPRAILLLLFLHLLPLGGLSHPLGGPGPASSGITELPDKVSELQAERMALEILQQGIAPTQAWEAREAQVTPTSIFGPEDVFQALWGLPSRKTKRDSGCFGRRLDRISFHSGLGCNGDEDTPSQNTHCPNPASASEFFQVLSCMKLSVGAPMAAQLLRCFGKAVASRWEPLEVNQQECGSSSRGSGGLSGLPKAEGL
ncbi:natriuretic peptides B [Cynocephalus volans]|uniref:natriuretic peptides B n=1 Tax=Cynocephalus volans TaxID=110931 RepID=UPI002FC8124B